MSSAIHQTNYCVHDFTFIDHLGQGAFGLVCKARERSTGKIYALKIQSLPRLKEASVDYMEEITIQSLLNNPHIVSLYGWFMGPAPSKKWRSHSAEAREDIGSDDKCVYMILEFVREGDLLDYTRKHSLSDDVVLALGKQLVSAIEHFHSKGVIHRDIKLENILIDSVIDDIPQIKISDFGLSTIKENPCDRVGTTCYMAPEVIRGDKYSKEADLWSLGVLIYEITVGYLPFETSESSRESSESYRIITECMILEGDIDYKPIKSDKIKGIIEILLNLEPSQRVLRRAKK